MLYKNRVKGEHPYALCYVSSDEENCDLMGLQKIQAFFKEIRNIENFSIKWYLYTNGKRFEKLKYRANS